MDLQTLSDEPVTSENALFPNNFRPYSPLTTAESRLQPDCRGEQFALTHCTKTSSQPQPQAMMVEIVRHFCLLQLLKLRLGGWPPGPR